MYSVSLINTSILLKRYSFLLILLIHSTNVLKSPMPTANENEARTCQTRRRLATAIAPMKRSEAAAGQWSQRHRVIKNRLRGIVISAVLTWKVFTLRVNICWFVSRVHERLTFNSTRPHLH